MVELTDIDIQNLLKIMDRAEIKGSEAMAFAVLQQKLGKMRSDLATPEKEEE